MCIRDSIWDERTMLAALQTIENPALHLAVHMSMILSLREGEILGLQPGDLDFDAADGRGTISVNKALQRRQHGALIPDGAFFGVDLEMCIRDRPRPA